jgi:hypothetical protein
MYRSTLEVVFLVAFAVGVVKGVVEFVTRAMRDR